MTEDHIKRRSQCHLVAMRRNERWVHQWRGGGDARLPRSPSGAELPRPPNAACSFNYLLYFRLKQTALKNQPAGLFVFSEERNYICDQCGQTFKQRKHLSVHQMRHSGAKPLQCEVCGFQCRQRASLKYHMTKHKAEADLEFECLMCRKRFEKAHNLNVHMSMVHPLIQAEVLRSGNKERHTDLQTIGLTGEVVQQDQDR
ncbi:hypothetical protein ATANTOWER_027243 [Ataeniobius toweri]|uniref:C2H2-type domain-containing protein n=1 Tax=Ataeniobius toweri TaxID=208326 RepID=A0ABU7C3R3_9TELE|nr:hypothetical protein [Ataeniobius toweri]